MTSVLDWRNRSDNHVVLEQALHALSAGQLVGFPTDTVYAVAASVLAAEAVEQLAKLVPGQQAELTLVVPSSGHALDWVPEMSPLGQRLARRCWPGPVTLVFHGDLEGGLVSRISPAVRKLLILQENLAIYVPEHDALTHALLLLPAPLVLLSTGHPGLAAVTSAERLHEITGDQLALIIDDGPSRSDKPTTALEVRGETWKVVREGAVSAAELARLLARLIVFVCTGNTCRSPMAEALCSKLLAERLQCSPQELPSRGYIVRSAGVAALAGDQAAPEAVAAVKEHGADLAGHVSRPLTPDLVVQADHLIAMTRSHVLAVAARFAPLGAQPRLLDPAGNDIADPIGAELEVYRDCAKQILEYIERWLPELTG